MSILFVIMMVCSLEAVLSVKDTKIYQNLSSTTMIGPIVDKNMRSLSIENLTNDKSWQSKDFDVFLMSVPGLSPFVVLKETENETTEFDGDRKDTFKAEEGDAPAIDLNKIQYFSKSFHIGRIHLKPLDAITALNNNAKQK